MPRCLVKSSANFCFLNETTKGDYSIRPYVATGPAMNGVAGYDSDTLVYMEVNQVLGGIVVSDVKCFLLIFLPFSLLISAFIFPCRMEDVSQRANVWLWLTMVLQIGRYVSAHFAAFLWWISCFAYHRYHYSLPLPSPSVFAGCIGHSVSVRIIGLFEGLFRDCYKPCPFNRRPKFNVFMSFVFFKFSVLL